MKCTGVWHRAKCTRCGNTDPTYHTGYDEHSMYVSSSRAATCTSSGYKTYTCSHGCGYTYTETLSALGHNMTSSTSCSGTATCVSKRTCTTTHSCTRCSYSYTKKTETSGSHNYQGRYIHETPGAPSGGGYYYKKCTYCNDILITEYF